MIRFGRVTGMVLGAALAVMLAGAPAWAAEKKVKETKVKEVAPKEKETKEIGSDKQTGGPTQQDRDTMQEIKERAQALKERVEKERKERQQKQ
ncbi:MAG: hypothetical protein HYZ11_11445 [Candidatus Tectomicrobia bacterium]|uniref:Uncharacterized protein n=1 Tax=Tectimicrobiota bacterium TaxID=2528274 RepID=A0A932I1K1_UNCTE|nr:hypothetical protein [Candidatus Tectomicrobia bacterium]